MSELFLPHQMLYGWYQLFSLKQLKSCNSRYNSGNSWSEWYYPCWKIKNHEKALIFNEIVIFALSLIFISDSENDDSRGGHLWSLLASLSHLFYRNIVLSTNNKLRIHSRSVPSFLLAGDEQFDVQSNHLLLDELKVRCQHISYAYQLLISLWCGMYTASLETFYLREIIKRILFFAFFSVESNEN